MPTRTLPEQFGRYRIVRKLGEGGMGAVYLAEDPALERRIALKVPHFDPEDGPHTIERFRREARIAAAIHHAHFCPVHEVGEVDGVHYLTMPFLEGTPLSHLVAPERLWPPARAVDLVRKLAGALGVLHSKGLIHRDLKPSNVMLGPDGEPVLLDFGLARAFGNSDQRLTTTGRVIGTPAYRAPEQIEGEAEALGPATDVYALGVLLYQLLTGRLPFEAPLMALYGQILHIAPRPPSSLRPDLDPDLDALCLRALAKKPGERFATMAEWAAALQAWLRRAEAASPPPPLPAGAGRLECPSCGKRLKPPAEPTGKKLVCPGCRHVVQPATEAHTRVRARPELANTQSAPTLATGEAPAPPTATSPPGRGPLWLAGGLALFLVTLGVGGLLWTGGPQRGAVPEGTGGATPGPLPQREPPSAVGKGPANKAPLPPQPPPAPAELELVLAGPVAVRAGDQQVVTVRVRRLRCPGPVQLTLKDLPAGVHADPAFIRAGADEGQVVLSADADAAGRSATARLHAAVGATEASSPLRVTVEPAALAPEFTNSIGMKLVLIPRGTFRMGSPEGEAERLDREGPRHEVEITPPFYLGAHEVTQAQYERVMGSNPSWFSATGSGKDNVAGQDTSNFPVEMVSWEDAKLFCEKLSWLEKERSSGRVYRLPTEAEWEYACRGGAISPQPFHFGESLSSTQANFDGNYPYGGAAKGPYLERTTTVGSYPANAFGLHDLHGNVWEWCADWYDQDYYQTSPRTDPPGPTTGTIRVLRGGSWDSDGRYCRAAFRYGSGPGVRLLGYGFRVVLVAARTP